MPKKVMITWGSVGGGHQSGMQALSEALVDLEPDVAVCAVNVLSKEATGFPITTFPDWYPLVSGRLTGIWRAIYHSTNKRSHFEWAERLGQPFGISRYKRVLQQIQPDVVVSVLPYVANSTYQIARRLGWNLPIGVVVMDLVSIHQSWISRGATWYALPTEEARQVVISEGIDPGKAHICGTPLRKIFWDEPQDRPALRRSLGLPPDTPVILVARGADGAGHLDDMVMALLNSGLSAHTVVVTGRNKRLREHLARQTQGRACTILGYVHNMAEWMWASDVLVTKAGPTTIAEAIRCGLPLVLTGAIPGQEEGNITFVERHGLGLVATGPAEIAAAVTGILTDETRAAEIKDAMQRVYRPNAAHAIARLILDTAQPGQAELAQAAQASAAGPGDWTDLL